MTGLMLTLAVYFLISTHLFPHHPCHQILNPPVPSSDLFSEPSFQDCGLLRRSLQHRLVSRGDHRDHLPMHSCQLLLESGSTRPLHYRAFEIRIRHINTQRSQRLHCRGIADPDGLEARFAERPQSRCLCHLSPGRRRHSRKCDPVDVFPKDQTFGSHM
jgi:hypothetical protein